MKYEITVGEVKTANSNVRGYASVVFGDSFKVSNITILEGRDNRLYISMPHYAKSGDGERKDICYPTKKEFRGGAGGKYPSCTGEFTADKTE